MPFAPVPVADWVLYHEQAIRQAVKDARAELSLLGASSIEGQKGRGRVSDRTARAAVKNVSALPCVVLDTGETVKNPEKWLAVLDEVRKRAEGCNVPSMIFDEWKRRYVEKSFYFGETAERCLSTNNESGRIITWIRFYTLVEARAAGLTSFSDDAIYSAVQAAAG